jgi:hypothetical protein
LYLSVDPTDGQVVQVSDGIVAVLLNYALGLLQIPNITKITLCIGGVFNALYISLLISNVPISICTYMLPLQGPLNVVGSENLDFFGPK